MLVPNWKAVLLKSWAVWFAAAGLALPELLQFVADNSDMLPMTDEWKRWIRLACLAGVILVRPIRQRSLQPPAIQPLKE